MKRQPPAFRPKATTSKQGEVFLAEHNAETPGAAVQADDPRLGAGGGGVPTTRTITTTAPLRIDGGGSADLSANRTLTVNSATDAAEGVVELATSGENAANKVVQGNDSRINVVTTKGDIYGASGANTPARIAVGTNDQVLMADSGQATGVKWASLTTTKGDVLAHDGSDPIRKAVGSDGLVLTAASSETTGLAWSSPSSFGFMFGTGEDGDLTLVANTSITDFSSNMVILQHDEVDLASFTLTKDGANDVWLVLCCKTSLTANNGSLVCSPGGGSSDTSAGASGGSGGGAGGTSGERAYGCWIYARRILGTGTATVNGGTGSNGANATAATATANGSAGANGSTSITAGGTTVPVTGGVNGGGGGGQSAGTGGTAGTGSSAPQASAAEIYKDPMPLFLMPQFQNATVSGGTSADFWRWYTGSLPGGAGAGGRNNGGAQAGGGGGSGASASNWWCQATAGSAGGAGAAGGSGAGGGAGGAGGSAGLMVVVSYYIASTWTFRAKGGTGGNGGNGFDRGGGGAGGPGGQGGWVAIAKGPQSQTPTTDVTGGTGGSGGTGGAIGGATGGTGLTGRDGRAVFYEL